MKKILGLILLTAVILWPLACGKNIAPTTSGPVTVVQVINTSTPTLPASTTPTNTFTITSTATVTATSTPNAFGGYVWGQVQVTGSPSLQAFSGFSSLVYNPATGSGQNGSMWLIGPGIWSSSDGSDWSVESNQAPSGRAYSTGLVYNNAMWVIGGYQSGYLNDVWTSTSGTSWTEATASASFPAREYHTSLVFNNTMWVIGGYNGAYYNDVWASTNGVNWYTALANTASPGSSQFSQRYGQTSLVYNGAMWVIGGTTNGTSGLNDVWTSTNGVSWTEITASAAFSGRWGHTSFVYNNAMWVVGGTTATGANTLNDVWYSTNGSTWTEATASETFTNEYSHPA